MLISHNLNTLLANLDVNMTVEFTVLHRLTDAMAWKGSTNTIITQNEFISTQWSHF